MEQDESCKDDTNNLSSLKGLALLGLFYPGLNVLGYFLSTLRDWFSCAGGNGFE
jgi:hypothetical protein